MKRVNTFYELSECKNPKYDIELNFFNGEPYSAWITKKNTNDNRLCYLPADIFSKKTHYNKILKSYGFNVRLS